MVISLSLREMVESDLPMLFTQQRDPEANYMAAFTAKDPQDLGAFMEHWTAILADPAIIKRTIVCDERVAGNIGSWPWQGNRDVGYWLGREYWGKGLATQALQQFLLIEKTRPLHASAASDNIASIRVLEKCGFRIAGYDRGFANARGGEIEEALLILE